MVVSHSVLLSAYRRRQDEVVAVALQQAYPRMGLILSAARALDNTYLFGDTYSIVFQRVVEILSDPSGPFQEGLLAIAATLTASRLIASIPIDASVKNITLAENLEKAAIVDLERIIALYKDGLVSGDGARELDTNRERTLYFALNLDLYSLSYTDFASINLDTSRPNSPVQQLETLHIDDDNYSYVYLYLSNKTGPVDGYVVSNSGALEVIVPMINGYTIHDVISSVITAVNNATLGALDCTNLLVGPNSKRPRSVQLDIDSKSYFPNELPKRTRASVWFETVSMSLGVRRHDVTIGKELVIMSAHTIALSAILPGYLGEWVAGTTYAIGDVVRYNGLFYRSLVAGLNPAPPSTQWGAVTITPAMAIAARTSSEYHIPGLLHSTEPDFSSMGEWGSRSLILEVKEGNYKALEPTLSTDYELNTFYFRTTGPLEGTLRLRISSSEPTEDSYAFLGTDDTLLIDVDGLTPMALVEALLQATYSISPYTEVLGAIRVDREGVPGITFTSFRESSREIREVIDLLAGDDGFPGTLEVGVGDEVVNRSAYTTNPRSLIITAKKQDNLNENKAALLDPNKNGGKVIRVTTGDMSPRLQDVFDRLRRLR
jgi:hypothetical protein